MTRKSKNAILTAPRAAENLSLKKDLYKRIFKVLETYLKESNWLAAIVLEESIISDRIESSMSKRKNINNLLSLTRNIENFERHADKRDPKYFELLKDLNAWQIDRNFAVHMLAKTHDGDNLNWNQRMERIRDTALKGEILAKELKKWAERKYNISNIPL